MESEDSLDDSLSLSAQTSAKDNCDAVLNAWVSSPNQRNAPAEVTGDPGPPAD